MPPTISIITATLNAQAYLAQLAEDLKAQTDTNFVWVVVDGGSTDGTLTAIPNDMPCTVDTVVERDFGIYDALNKGVRRCSTDYYLVLGADDRLEADAISRYRDLAARHDADLIASSVREDGRIKLPNRGKPWLRGQNAYIAHHSVGTLIKRRLHESVGYYSSAFPIAADHLFIKEAIAGGAKLHGAPEFVAGTFCRDGVSSSRYLACLFEFTLVQLRTEKLRSLQLLILLARIARHWRTALGGR